MQALFFSGTCMLAGLCLLFLIPEVMAVFTLVSTVSAIIIIFTWSMILLSYIAYRKHNPLAHQQSKFRMPGGVWAAVITQIFLLIVLGLLALEPDTRVALYVMPFWFLALLLAYQWRSKTAAANPDSNSVSMN